jgi:hypothetical protein
MKRLFLASIAALFLATGTAHAEMQDNWRNGSSKEYCVEVMKTSDGFLAVRAEPSVKAKLISTLRPGFPLTVNPANQSLNVNDYARFPKWIKWTYVRGWFDVEEGDTHPSSGWVYSKYIREVPCTPYAVVRPGSLPTFDNPDPK